MYVTPHGEARSGRNAGRASLSAARKTTTAAPRKSRKPRKPAAEAVIPPTPNQGDPVDDAGWIDPKGRYHSLKAIMERETLPPAVVPHLFMFRGEHDRTAEALLKKIDPEFACATEAQSAAKQPRYNDWTCSIYELMRRGWLRYRHYRDRCAFTTWQANKRSTENAWLTAEKREVCPKIEIEQCNNHGCDGGREFRSALDVLDWSNTLDGVRRRRRRRR